jgi:DNA polymerase-3 subunit beta
VSRLLASDEPVAISIADSQIKFVANGITITSRLIDGEFPNFQRIIPANSTIEWTVGTDDLTAALRRIELISRDDASRVTLSSHGDILTLAAKGDTGTASEELDVIAEGEDVEILFNARYLLDFMSSVSAEAISVKLSGSMAPGLFQPKSDDDIIYVVMCMQRIGQL